MATASEGKLARTKYLNVDNAAGARLLTVERRPDGIVVLVSRGGLDAFGGNTVLLSAEDAAALANYLTGKESDEDHGHA